MLIGISARGGETSLIRHGRSGDCGASRSWLLSYSGTWLSKILEVGKPCCLATPTLSQHPCPRVKFFTYRLNQYKGVDKLIASAEQRRDRTLRQIERRRESLARRLRKASDEIVESNVADLPRAA
jgi:hypothetical protein